MNQLRLWAPCLIFTFGAFLISGARVQRHLDLRGNLTTGISRDMFGLRGTDVRIAEGEAEVAGMDSYLFRSYAPVSPEVAPEVPPFTLYVGYYGSQAQGRTIHSPKNCLPGAGWEALNDTEETIVTPEGGIPVNRYLLQREGERVLVLYWYQGRGRVEANEYRVKFDLLKDSALHGRSDEALVRIVVPIESSEATAFAAAEEITRKVVPEIYALLPSS